MTSLLVLVLLAVVANLSLTAACPPKEDVIYLMHGGYCLTEYTVISDIALTADNPLHCVLAGSSGTGGGGGQWTGPDNTAVQCGGSGSGPFNCSQSSDPTNITLYKKTGASFSGQQLYTCTISGQSISVQIESNAVLSAIYIEPPADVRSVPQNYTIHCITVDNNSISQLFLEKHNHQFYGQNPPVVGFSQYAPALRLLSDSPVTYDSYEVVTWHADMVIVDSTEFGSQGLSASNGDHDWACRASVDMKFVDLQSYIRAPAVKIAVPTVLHKNATSITISWTAVENADDTDGYVVYYNTSTGYTSAIDVGNVTQHTLMDLFPQQLYTISVRAYQDLLGPKTEMTVRTDGAILHLLNWVLISKRSELKVAYRVDCITEFVQAGQVWFTVNNKTVNATQHRISSSTLMYNNSFTVMDETLLTDQIIGCRANVSFGRYDRSLTLKAPSGPPVVNQAVVQSSSSITVSWSPPVGGADGYVIIYSTEGSSNMTQLVEGGERTSSLLTGLSEGHLYTIRVFAYKDLPSSLSDTALIQLQGPEPVSDITVTVLSSSVTSISWTPPNTPGSSMSHYSIMYTDVTCTDQQSVTSIVNSTQLRLAPGHTYTITVQAVNNIGVSLASNKSFTLAPVKSPDGAPHGITGHAVNESAIMIYWEELSCALMNGDIISYSVSYTRDGDGDEKGLLVSVTERRLTFTDLEPLSRYTISVAAVNRNGTGPSSSPVTIATTTGTLNSLECLSLNQSSAVITWSMSYPLPHKRLHFEVNIAEALNCDQQTKLNSGLAFQTLKGVLVVSDLKPSTCYNITVTPVADGHENGEGQSIICRTARSDIVSVVVQIILISLVVLLGTCVICCSVCVLGYTVALRNRRYSRTKPSSPNIMPFRCQREPVAMVVSELYSTSFEEKGTPPPPLPPQNRRQQESINVYDQIRVNNNNNNNNNSTL